MLPNLRYLKTVLTHKWFVLVAGFKVGGIPLRRLLWHDWTKFMPCEWRPYVRKFQRGVKDREDFRRAFHHHMRNNPHHHEYWMCWGEPIEMPEKYAREMVADWMGAGRAYTGTWDVKEWYEANKHRINLHENTRALAEKLIYG